MLAALLASISLAQEPAAVSADAPSACHGQLVDRSGDALANARLWLRRTEEVTTTGPDGTFRLANVTDDPEPVVIEWITDEGIVSRRDWALVRACDRWQEFKLGCGGDRFEVPVERPTRDERVAIATDLAARWLDEAIDEGDYVQTRWRLLSLARLDVDFAVQRLWSSELDEMFANATVKSFRLLVICHGNRYLDSNVREGVDLREYVEALLRVRAAPFDQDVCDRYDALTTGRPHHSLVLFYRSIPPSAKAENPTERDASEPDLEAKLERVRASGRDASDGLMREAVRLARDDPEPAIQLALEANELRRQRHPWATVDYRTPQFLYALARSAPERAIALARDLDPTGYSHALVAMALATNAEPSIAAARRVLERGFALMESDPSPFRDHAWVGLARAALEVDSDRFDAWLARTLRRRAVPTVRQSDAHLAWVLRDREPALARALLGPELRRAPELDRFDADAWEIAAYFDPVETADFARSIGGKWLNEVANALVRDPPGPYPSARTGLAWWPRSD